MKSISLHLTDQCNNSCVFCVVNSHKEKKEGVKKSILYKYLEDHANKGYESVNIHGGEATVIDDFIEILAKIQELGYPMVSLQTNGRKLADPAYAEDLFQRGVRLFIISVHGKDAEQHDRVTRENGSFEEAVRGIRNVTALGAKVRTNSVIYKGNNATFPEIIQFVLALNVDHVNISALHPAGKAYQNFLAVTPRFPEIQKAVFESVELCVNAQRTVTLEGFPLCAIPGYEKYMIRWDENHFKLLFHNYVFKNYAEFMNNEARRKGTNCANCLVQKDCGGVYKEYIEFYGWEDFKPFT